MANFLQTVSIIIPCYNSQEYIIETLDSVFSQTYQNIEVIAIDDGSTDNTLNLLKDYANREIRLKVVSQENTYCVIARQNALNCLENSEEREFLMFLDSDDKIDATYIEKCVSIANQKPDVDIVYSKARFFGARNDIWDLEDFKLPNFLHVNCIYISALIRKSAFDRVGGFDKRMTHFEDWELYINMIKHGSKVHRIDEVLFYYRQRQNGSSVSDKANDEKLSENILRIYNKHYDFYIKNGIYLHKLIMRDFLKIQQDDTKKSKKGFLSWILK